MNRPGAAVAAAPADGAQQRMRLAVLSGLVLICLALQLFLATISLQLWMVGTRPPLLPALIVSLLLFAVIWWLVRRVDRC